MSLERRDGRGPEPEVWTTEAFLQHFLRVHDQMLDRSFAFVLGAGAPVFRTVMGSSRVNGPPRGRRLA